MGSTLCTQVGTQGCVLHNPPLPPPHTHRKGTNIVLWTEEQELELERLFEEFRGSDGEWVPRGGMCGGGPTPCRTFPPPLPTDSDATASSDSDGETPKGAEPPPLKR